MKKIMKLSVPCLVMLGILLVGLAQAQDQKTKEKEKVKKMDQTMQGMPYTATYSSKFEIGNPAQAKLILELWKDWDDNMLDKHSGYFADTITMYHPDGQVIKGRDSTLAEAKRYRGSMASAKSMVHAWIPLKSVDKNENWVAIWGTEEDTWKDGKKTVTSLHEIWKFNKEGKIAEVRQFESKVLEGK